MSVGVDRERQFARLAQRDVLVVATAILAFLVTACSGGGGGGGGSSGGSPGRLAAAGGSTVYQHALAFAQCMRSHGVPGFPDPNSRGEIIEQGSMGGSAAQNATAQRACLHLLGGQNTPAQTRQQLGQALRFAACMRSHGDAEFPDPSVRHGGVVLHMVGADTAQGKTAVQTCERLTRYTAE